MFRVHLSATPSCIQEITSIYLQLISADSEGNQETAGRFRVETGEREVDEMISPVSSPVHLENPESQTRWYFKYFLGKCKFLKFIQ